MKNFFAFFNNFLFGYYRAYVLEVMAFNGEIFVKTDNGKLGLLDAKSEDKRVEGGHYIGQIVRNEPVRTLQYSPCGGYDIEQICGYGREWIVRYSKEGEALGYGIMKVSKKNIPPIRCHGELAGYGFLPVFRIVN